MSNQQSHSVGPSQISFSHGLIEGDKRSSECGVFVFLQVLKYLYLGLKEAKNIGSVKFQIRQAFTPQ